ncbi:hypothetical protein RUM43_014396 [Polyplax serrata]|uniref:Uncharacterized protein n=1 Tax=Polyplax serrata TaxID=468196 RepID=A0AAN8S2M5_POLSC
MVRGWGEGGRREEGLPPYQQRLPRNLAKFQVSGFGVLFPGSWSWGRVPVEFSSQEPPRVSCFHNFQLEQYLFVLGCVLVPDMKPVTSVRTEQ